MGLRGRLARADAEVCTTLLLSRSLKRPERKRAEPRRVPSVVAIARLRLQSFNSRSASVRRSHLPRGDSAHRAVCAKPHQQPVFCKMPCGVFSTGRDGRWALLDLASMAEGDGAACRSEIVSGIGAYEAEKWASGWGAGSSWEGLVGRHTSNLRVLSFRICRTLRHAV